MSNILLKPTSGMVDEIKITDGTQTLDLADLKRLESKELLQLILIELKRISTHLQVITDEEV